MTTRTRRRLLAGLAVVAALAAFTAANVRLLQASFLSQPDCVPHLKTPGRDGAFRAAQPSC